MNNSETRASARVGVSSDRRRDWLLTRRPDLVACDIRRNVSERLAQLDARQYDALILASAGLIRLCLTERIIEVYGLEEFESAPGQGALALVIRSANKELREAHSALNLGGREELPWV